MFESVGDNSEKGMMILCVAVVGVLLEWANFIFQITSTGDKSYLRLQSPRLEGALTGALHDACVPFPKTCGARFCQVGILVTFIQPLNSKGISFRHQNTTPR